MHTDIVLRHARVTSTMDVCRDLLAQGAGDFTVVVADEQSAGRGRATHHWHSPPGTGLYISIVLLPRLQAQQGPWLTMIGALAVLDALREYAPLLAAGAGIKWFNDVQYGGRKLAGVLVEAQLGGPQLATIEHAILGIGLNVNMRFDDASADVQARATSLAEILGAEQDRERLLSLVLAFARARYQQAQRGHSPLHDYRHALNTLGQTVTVRQGDALISGLAERVDDDGALVLRTDAGEHRMVAGDIV